MSYIVPSVQVYQILQNAGGVLNSTPDLEACIVGPCYNVVRYAAEPVAQNATFVGQFSDFTKNITLTPNSVLPGQEYEEQTLQVFLDNATITSFHAETGITHVANTTTLRIAGGGLQGTSAAGTPKVRPGDTVLLTYTPSGGTATVVTSTVQSVINDTDLSLSDMIPTDATTFTQMEVRQVWNDILVDDQYVDTANLNSEGTLSLQASFTVAQGTPVSAKVHVSYRALRTDLSGQIVTAKSIDELKGYLQNVGDINEENPLALAGQIALANTVTQISFIGINDTSLIGYQSALDLSEGRRLYSMVPLSQATEVLSLFKTHVEQMSTPEMASWRVTLVSPKVPTVKFIGQGTDTAPYVNANITVNSDGKSILVYTSGSFLTDGVTPGDIVTVTAAAPTTAVKNFTVKTVLSNQQLELMETQTAATINAFYVSRKLNRSSQAQEIAKMAKQANSRRYILSVPDEVGVSIGGAVKYLPGYYLCAGLAGMVAGFPVQQGFTNIGIAGIADLRHSNFYFTRTDLNTMAEAGVFLWVQAVQAGQPYCRHELTTDVSVLENRELMKVKNWDFLSYYYYDKLSPFIGSWNLTPDTLNTIRQTIIAASELLKNKRLPKIGAPLVSYQIAKLAQNSVNRDNLDIVLNIAMADPNNYTNLYLTV